MKVNGIMLIILSLVLILTLGAVSAADENVTSDVTLEMKSFADDVSGEVNVNANTFSDLSDLIESTPEGGILELDRDFENDGFTAGVTISKTMTIDGHNHALDGNATSRIFAVEAGGVILKNIVFKNGKSSSSSGGAIVWKGAEGTLSNCSFVNCSFMHNGYAEFLGGGAVYWAGADGTISNSGFVDCSSSGHGGAIYQGGDKAIISNCSFVRCNSKDYGGAVYNYGSNCSIAASSFDECWHGVGGVVFNRGINFAVESSDFTRSSCDGGTRAINNRASGLKVTSCSFTNFKDTFAAAIFNENDGCEIASSTFTNCTARYGAAIVNQPGCSLNVESCNFTRCSAYDGHGGAIWNMGHVSSIVSCYFTDCSSTSHGGAVWDKSDDFIMKSCAFTDCLAGENGGALYRLGPRSTIGSCTFTTCHAKPHGGAIWDKSTSSNITSCRFVGCFADENGGAIYRDVSNANIVSCIFSDCKAELNGGAIWDKGEDSDISSCSFTRCLAESSGGAIYRLSNEGKVNSCSFTGCLAKGDGGAIWDKSLDGKILSCRFSNCRDSSDRSVYDGADVVVENCSYDGVIYPIVSASNLEVSYYSSAYYEVTVYGADAWFAKDTRVDITINGVKIEPLTTNGHGIARFKVTQNPGTYKLSVTSLGKTVDATLTVNHLLKLKKTSIKRSAKKLVLTATMAKINGQIPKNKMVQFKFNGKAYKARTDKKGVASVTIQSKVLKKLKVGQKVIYQASFKKDTVKKTVKVKS